MVPSRPPGHASLGRLWEYLVATLTLRPTAAMAAMAATSSSSVLGYVTLAARQVAQSGKEPYTLVTVQSDVPRAQTTGVGGGLDPARWMRSPTATRRVVAGLPGSQWLQLNEWTNMASSYSWMTRVLTVDMTFWMTRVRIRLNHCTPVLLFFL